MAISRLGQVAAVLTAAGLWLGGSATADPVQSCKLTFEVVAGNSIGTIGPGETLTGTVEFTVQSSWRQGSETVSYFSAGTMTVERAGQGAVTGRIGVVHVIRTPHTADYISIDATGAAGDLGGRLSYADPMLVTLYARPGTLPGSDLPRTEAEWNILAPRRDFQVHTPTAMTVFFGAVGPMSGGCS